MAPCTGHLLCAILTGFILRGHAVNPDCKDLIDNCVLYQKYVCEGVYKPWASVRCRAFCGFCQPPPTTVGPCFDVLPNCYEYQDDMCTNPKYYFWAKGHCSRSCEFCHPGTTPGILTPPAPTRKSPVTPPRKAETPGIRTPPPIKHKVPPTPPTPPPAIHNTPQVPPVLSPHRIQSPPAVGKRSQVH